jgi:hypothetical protein
MQKQFKVEILNPKLAWAGGEVGSSFKSGIVDVSIRATDFESMLAANIIFLPAISNFSKPFVALGEIGIDGQLHFSNLQKEFEESQK